MRQKLLFRFGRGLALGTVLPFPIQFLLQALLALQRRFQLAAQIFGDAQGFEMMRFAFLQIDSKLLQFGG